MIWNTAKLGDVCFIQSGNSIAAKKKTELFTDVVGTPYIATKDVGFNGSINYINGIYIPQEYVNSFKISQSGSTLICAEGGSAGRKIAFSMDDCCFGNKLFSITPNDSLDAKYIYYYTLNEEFQSQFKAALHGLIGGVSLKKIKEFTISIPPLSEQQRIVTKLDTAFAEIDKEIRNIESKIRNVSDLFRNLLDDALGKNKTTPLINVCHKITDGSHYSPKTLSDEYPFITVKDICDDKINFKNCKYVDKSFYEDLVKNNCKPINGDVLFSKDGTVGKVSLVDYEKDFVVLSSLAILSPNKNFIIPKFLFYTLKSKSFIDEAVGKKTGAAIRRIILKTLKNIKISVPEVNEQTTLVEILDKLSFEQSKLTKLLKLKLQNMNQLKNSLMRETLLDSKKNNTV